LPLLTSPHTLFAGILDALTIGKSNTARYKKRAASLLGWSIVGLGAGTDLIAISQVGLRGLGYTVIGISGTLFLGYLFGRLLKVSNELSLLLSVGTSICGGSAIAAVSTTIHADHRNISLSLVTVFLLNAVALFLFPPLGHYFDLTQTQFGLWSALAIHDTSSVVGACLQYGTDALKTGTTVKLARALWIMPVAAIAGYFYHRKTKTDDGRKAFTMPWFLLGFLAAAALVTFLPAFQPYGRHVESLAKRGMVMALFFIGSGFTRDALKNVGWKPFAQGVLLWLCVGSATLAAILMNWIL
jgi:uncharacterized integral membrane protein (TIGR00698 family)